MDAAKVANHPDSRWRPNRHRGRSSGIKGSRWSDLLLRALRPLRPSPARRGAVSAGSRPWAI